MTFKALSKGEKQVTWIKLIRLGGRSVLSDKPSWWFCSPCSATCLGAATAPWTRMFRRGQNLSGIWKPDGEQCKRVSWPGLCLLLCKSIPKIPHFENRKHIIETRDWNHSQSWAWCPAPSILKSLTKGIKTMTPEGVLRLFVHLTLPILYLDMKPVMI